MATHILQNAHHIALNNPHFIDNSVINIHATSGLNILLRASIPEATHDSSARHPPPRCHPGTRQQYIDGITRWALNSPHERVGRILWMTGPAGVGKSAVAQSCAEILGEHLGASFFFSRPNSRNNPNMLFTSIAHQLATKIDSYGNILDNKIRRNPTLVTKSIRQQFESLIVAPIQELKARNENMSELAIIIDGIDECAENKAHCDIIETVAASVLDRTTPLLWIFVTRPEPHIIMKFTSSRISPLSLHMELPVSRDIDHEICQYLTDELERIRKEHDLPSSWLSERDIGTLVNLSAGLFVYAATVVRFVGERNSSCPEDQLQAVLALATHSRKDDSNHPLSELDLFYTLIMQRIPLKTLPIAQKVLLATTLSGGTNAIAAANLLSLSESQFRNACCMLHSVLALYMPGPIIDFHHASFVEFLQDPARSRKFCITTNCAVSMRQGLLEDLNRIHASSIPGPIEIPVTWMLDEPNCVHVYIFKVMAFFRLCQSAPLDTQMLAALTEFQYALIPVIWGECAGFLADELSVDAFLQKIPEKYLGKIFRPYPKILFHPSLVTKPEHRHVIWKRPYVLGHGKNKVLCWESQFGGSVIDSYPNHWIGIINLIKSKTMRSHKDRARTLDSSLQGHNPQRYTPGFLLLD